MSERDMHARNRRKSEREREKDCIARTLLTCGSSQRGYVVTFTLSQLVAHSLVSIALAIVDGL